MSIPKNGKVVIVDDHIDEESFPLLLALSSECISFSCYTGRVSELPMFPLKGVRLLFLDLKLEGLPGTFDTNDIISSIKPVIEKLISPDNGPYVIFGWTDTPNQLQEVIDSLIFKPITFISMDKSECLTSTNPIKLIKKKLHKKIAELGKIGLIFKWENFVNESAFLTTNNLLEVIENKNNLENILFKIAEAYLGTHINNVIPAIKKRALFQMLNSFLLSTSLSNLFNLDLRKYGDLQEKEKPNEDHLAKLNTKFLFNSKPNEIIVPGNIYLSHNKVVNAICKSLLDDRLERKNIYKKINNEMSNNQVGDWSKLSAMGRQTRVEKELFVRLPIIKKEIKKIFIEVTPVCDYSQNAFRVHRVLCGLMYPAKYESFFKKDQIEGSLYISKKFYFDRYKDTYQFMLYFRGFLTLQKKELQNHHAILSINQELLFDIQHRIGNHLSRPGVSTVA